MIDEPVMRQSAADNFGPRDRQNVSLRAGMIFGGGGASQQAEPMDRRLPKSKCPDPTAIVTWWVPTTAVKPILLISHAAQTTSLLDLATAAAIACARPRSCGRVLRTLLATNEGGQRCRAVGCSG